MFSAAARLSKPLALVVEDEPVIRLCTADILESIGFDVAEAGSVDEAFAKLDTGINVSLIVTDLHMPGRDGADLVNHVQEQFPAVPVLVVSAMVGAAQSGSDVFLLAKPFSEDQLRSAVINIVPSVSTTAQRPHA